MNQELKKNINLLVPVIASGGAGLLLYRRGKSAQWLIAGVVITFLIVWLVTRQVTKTIENITESPDHVNVDPDAAGTIDQNFDPRPYTNQLKDDIYAAWWVIRDGAIYATILQLSNANLVKIYNDWNERYYALDKETMIQAMQGETYGNFNATAHNAASIISRLKGMGLN